MVVKIFDVTGKVVKEIGDCFANARNDGLVRISLDGIKNGIYFLTLQTQEKRIIERLVIIK